MSTNDTEATEAPAEEVSTTQEDEQLRRDLKNSLANDTKTEAADTETVSNTETASAESTSEAEAKADATLTNEVPPEPPKDLDWYVKAYDTSTTEAMRLKKRVEELEANKVEPPAPVAPAPSDEVLTPEQLWIRQKRDEEVAEAFSEITAKYPSIKDPDTYKRFVTEANLVGQVIVQSEKRSPSAKELYDKTAVILGLTPDNSEAIGAALKDSGATTRTSSGTPSLPPASKVSEAMIAMNLKMYPLKSRQEIIEELEPHIN